MKKLLIFFFLILFCENNKTKIYSGVFTAENYLLRSEVGGKILSIYFEEGDKVEKGDTIALIDNREIKFIIESMEYKVKGLKIQLENLNEDLRKAEKLFRNSAISEIEFERVKRSRDLVATELKGTIASLEAQKENLKKFFIISPVDGYISSKYLKVGEVVIPGTPIFEVQDPSLIYLNIYVTEEDLPKVSIGDEVKIKVDAFPEDIFKGKVSFISEKAEFTPKNIQTKEDRTLLVYRVKITVENPEGKIKSGIYGDAFFY
ncbi:MAG: efflux RND transporter periplasmic adaptor subunit [candidate division WOR-3 bacterium]